MAAAGNIQVRGQTSHFPFCELRTLLRSLYMQVRPRGNTAAPWCTRLGLACARTLCRHVEPPPPPPPLSSAAAAAVRKGSVAAVS